MLKQLRNGRFLLLLCFVGMLAAGPPAVISVFQLIHLRGDVEQIERADAVSVGARNVLEILGHSLSSFTAVFVDLTPDERAEMLEEADQQFAKLEPAIKQFRAAAVGFLPDAEAEKLSKSIELIVHSWTDIREKFGKRASWDEGTDHFLETLKIIRSARRILVSLESDTEALAQTATKAIFKDIERVSLYLFFALSGGALIGLIAVIGNYQFAQSVRRTNKELRQKNVEIAERDHQSIAQNQRFDAALNNMSQGLCMFDGDQRLIVCNQRYASLYGLPSGLVRPGTTFREILQHRVNNEVFAGDSPDDYIDERIAAVAEEQTSTKIHTLTDGRIIAIYHQPMPGGGWVATHDDITELRMTEEALRKSEELSSTALRASPDPLSITDPIDGTYFDVNESWSDALKYTREEAVGKSALELGIWVDPDDRKRFIDKITKEGSVRDFETRFRTRDGDELDILAFGEYLDVGGEPRLLMVAQDVTERKRAENALRESEELFSRVFHVGPTACAISAPEDGHHYDVNEGWTKLLGYTREEALENTAVSLGIWSDPDERVRFVNLLRANGSAEAFETKFRTKSGEEIDVLTSGVYVEFHGEPRLFIVYDDITNRNKAEQALRESEDLFSKVFQASPAACAITNSDDGSYYDVNEAWMALLGYSREEAMANTVYELGIWADPDARAQFVDQLKRERSVRAYEAIFRTKGGALRDVLASGEALDIGGESRLVIVAQDITDRKKAKEALLESETRLRAFFDNTPMCLNLKDTDGRYLLANKGYEEWWGRSAHEVIGKKADEFQDDCFGGRQMSDAELAVLETGAVHEKEISVKRPADEHVCDRLLIKFPVKDVDGSITAIGTVAIDITARKQAEKALRESEQRFKDLVETTNVVPWEFNPRTMRFTYVGPQAVNLFGYPIDTWYGDEFWLKVIHPEDREETASTCQLAVERGEDHELQYRMMTANGREVWVRDIVTVVDGGTDAMMLRGLFIDITILKQAEQKTRTSQQRFRDIVETASDWIWECDADLRYTFVSERYTEMTGLPVEKVIGRTRQEISKGAQVDPGSDWKSHFADLEAQRPFRDFRYHITASSGDTLHFSISGTPVFDDSGNFAGYRGTGANTTAEMLARAELVRNRDRLQQMVETATADLQAKAEQLRRALEREKQLNEQQRQFVSMASHEFRTPLAVIDGLVQRMIRRKDKLLPDELEMRANKIRGAVGTITTLMESTLTAARMDSGKININVGTIDLRRIIDEICRRQLLVDGDHKILRDLDGLPDTVIGDRGALDQVFTNLLSNAMKYSPGGTDVTVKGWCEGDTAIVTVQDKGLGIDEDDLPKMFTRFFRAKTSTGIPGTGIGLNLVKALIELHEGKISVQSRKGLGSIFTVELPVNGPSHRERSGDRAA